MRAALVVFAAVSLLVVPAASSAQCYTCGPGLRCISGPRSIATACFEVGRGICVLTGECVTGGGRGFVDPLGESVIGITLVEASAAVTPPPRALPRAGRALVGREAARVLRERMSPTAPDGEVVFGALLHGAAGATVAMRSPQGDGFSLRRDREGPLGVRLTVRQLEHGRPGRVLASDRLAEDDLLIVPVRFDGRVRVVTLQAVRAAAADQEHKLQPLRAALAELPPQGTGLPFEAEIIAE